MRRESMTLTAETPRPGAAERIIEGVLPFWAEAGWDRTRGGFYEALAADGAPAPEPFRRTRVQCRQIFTFAVAADQGWTPQGHEIAARGFAYLLRTAFPDGPRAGAVHRLDAAGGVLDPTRDLYDQAFVVLAAASVWASLGDPAARDLLDDIGAFLDAGLSSPAGGYHENDARALPRRQNPHMHLFEACTAAAAATGEPVWAARADALRALFFDRLLDGPTGVLREYFDAALAPAPGPAGDIVEPGHMMEWVSLLDAHDALTDASDTGPLLQLFRRAHGFSGSAGLAPFAPDQASFATGRALSSSRRLWAQTEAARAALVIARRCPARSGGAEALAYADEILSAIARTYFAHPHPGLWTDCFDADGAPMTDLAPASIPYHLTTLALESRRRP